MDSVVASEAIDPGSTPGARTTEGPNNLEFTASFPTLPVSEGNNQR